MYNPTGRNTLEQTLGMMQYLTPFSSVSQFPAYTLSMSGLDSETCPPVCLPLLKSGVCMVHTKIDT